MALLPGIDLHNKWLNDGEEGELRGDIVINEETTTMEELKITPASVETTDEMIKFLMNQVEELKAENATLKERLGLDSASGGKGRIRLSTSDWNDMVRDIIKKIMSWNDDHAGDREQQWFISGSLISELLRENNYTAAQGRIKDVLSPMADILAKHHEGHGLNMKWNSKFLGKRISDDISLSSYPA